jgi:hypothetical protein
MAAREGKGGPAGAGAAALAGAVALSAAAGCGGPAGAQHRAQGATPSAAASSAPLSDWQRLGATEAPPASLQTVSLGGIAVDDQAAPTVTPAQARTWAQAYLRTLGYLTWAVGHGQDSFLLRSRLASVATVVQPNVADVVQARRAGQQVWYQNPTIRRIVVRAVPQGLEGALQGQLYAWKPYAIFLDQIGRAAKRWVDPQGRQTVKAQIPAGAAAYELVGGELSHAPPMGDVWVMASDANCTSPNARQALAPLCDP